MRRAIQLAKNGLGTTYPNPMVGAVIVCENIIIGEGFTSPYGGAHAEVNAINSVSNFSLLKNATIYVTLEPCSHFGKTPPCADLITKHKIPNVVIGTLDPHEKVAGKGVQKLKNGGCKVTVGVLENECREHHARFLTFHQKKRPYIILKWAETQDGYIAPENEERKENPEPYWITNTYSKQLVHQWRSEEQAILIGTTTAIADNPKLDVRLWSGHSPLRVVLDKDLKINPDFNIFDKSVPTLILTAVKDGSAYQEGIDYEVIDFNKSLAQQICKVLYKHNITSVIVEGGTQTILNFTNENLWDEARVFTGSSYFKKGLKAPSIIGNKVASTHIENDILNYYIK